jgi:hypothetical protein
MRPSQPPSMTWTRLAALWPKNRSRSSAVVDGTVALALSAPVRESLACQVR